MNNFGNRISFDVTYSSSGSGIPDWWIQKYFPGLLSSGTGLDPNGYVPWSGSALTYLEFYQQGLDPLDFYNGQTPVLSILGGDGQTGSPNPPNSFVPAPLVVSVTDSNGNPIVDAPVTFLVTSGSGQVQLSSTSAPAGAQTALADSNGQAQVYFKLPPIVSNTSQITAAAGPPAQQAQATFTEDSDDGSGSYISPFAPSNIIGTMNADGSETITWQNNDNQSPIYVYQQQSNGSWIVTGTLAAGTTTYTGSASTVGSIEIGNNYSPGGSTGGGGNGSANFNPGNGPPFVPIPVQTYAAIDMSGTTTVVGGQDQGVSMIDMDDSNNVSYGFTVVSGTYELAPGPNAPSDNDEISPLDVPQGGVYAYTWANGSATLDGTTALSLYLAPEDPNPTTWNFQVVYPTAITTTGTLIGGLLLGSYGATTSGSGNWAFSDTGMTFRSNNAGNITPIYLPYPFGDSDYTVGEALSEESFTGAGFLGGGGGSSPTYVSSSGNIIGTGQEELVEGASLEPSSWPQFSYVITGGITTVFDAVTDYSGYVIPSNLVINKTGFTPWMINNVGSCAGYDGSNNAAFWPGTGTGITELAPMGSVNAMNDQNQVVGVGGANAYLWTPANTSSACSLVISGTATPISQLLPLTYRNKVVNISPIDISGTDANGDVRILFTAQYQNTPNAMPPPVLGGTSTGWAPGTFLLTLESGTQTDLELVSLPSNVNNLGAGILNAQGLIANIGNITTTTTSGATTTGTNHAVLLLPVELKVVNRDDPTQTWADGPKLATGPIYGGDADGDMVSFKILGTDTWTGATFSWSASGPESITGPSGVGVNTWKIEDEDGNDPTGYNWLTWSPGKYTITCNVTFSNGSTNQLQFAQEVGERTDDVLVIGWIDPQQVPLNSSGVQSALTQVLPPGGLSDSSTDEAKAKAAQLVGILSTQGADFSFEIGPSSDPSSFTPFSAADKTYALDWMFKYAGNNTPPSSFTDSNGYFSEQQLDQFISQNNRTDYKLINHFQDKFLVDDNQKFKQGSLIHLKHDVEIGSTLDPTWFYDIHGTIAYWVALVGQVLNGYPTNGVFPGQPGPENSSTPLTTDTTSKLCNEGRPDQRALDAFKNLTGKDQGQIWSSITFFPDLQFYSQTISSTTHKSLTRIPTPNDVSEPRINTQVYPTYWIYSDGQKQGEQNQAPSPSALFPNLDKCQ